MSARLVIVFVGLIGVNLPAFADGVTPPAAPVPAVALDASKLKLGSTNALVLDASAGQPIYAKGADAVTPIASVTKLMALMKSDVKKKPKARTIKKPIKKRH